MNGQIDEKLDMSEEAGFIDEADINRSAGEGMVATELNHRPQGFVRGSKRHGQSQEDERLS